MIFLRHKRIRFFSIVDNYSSLYSYSDHKTQLTVSAGIVNFIWNQWNLFWREFWIAYVSGGIDFNNNIINPIYPDYDDQQSCAYLLYLCGKRKHYLPGDRITGSCQEATWGDPKIIIEIASHINTTNNSYDMCYLLGLISNYQNQINHFKQIRNCFIHLNNENVRNLSNIANYYIFSPDQKLIDILETTNFNEHKRCFNYLIDNLSGMIKNL